jgi:acyl-CoA thioester hydrolase
MSEFFLPIRVYIEDTDAGGIVYYANYLKFMERARTECLRKRGIELDVWQDQHRRIFVVRRVNVDFKQPARFNEQITVSAKIMTVNRASMELSQHVFREDNVLCTAKVELACVDADTLRPTRIPVTIKEALACEH